MYTVLIMYTELVPRKKDLSFLTALSVAALSIENH